MNLLAPVDIYCERLAPGLLAEPLNAVSNIGFFIAAYLLFRRLPKDTPSDLRFLVALIAAIGIGSLLFHTTAIALTALLDVAFIALFILFYVHAFLHRVHNLKRWEALFGAATFLCFAIVVHLLVQVIKFSAISMYLSSLLMLWVFAGDLFRRRHAQARRMLAAALLFTLSLSLRTLDAPWCEGWPAGTHFLWHLLNAGVLFLLVQVLISSQKLNGR